MYLLDTNVVSEQRKMGTGKEDINVAAWTATVSVDFMYLSVITTRELETWVLRRERRDADQGKHMRRWFDNRVMVAFQGRVLDINPLIAHRCAELFVPDPRPIADAYIAATALVHNLTVVTRNIADFAPMGVKLLNPWEPQ
jgi:toxin FitB